MGTRRHRGILLQRLALAVSLALFCLVGTAAAAGRRPPSEEEKQEYQAMRMLRKGVDYLEQNLEEQGLKLIRDVPRMYPKTEARFKAYLELGKYLTGKRRFEEAIKALRQVQESENPEEQAEALYQIGISYYHLGQYSQAFAHLRRVNTDFPWSVYANESYYYIGLCHFKLGRWAKAVEALKMVGTSVPPQEKLETEDGRYKAEAGQRFHVRVFDRDLVVLQEIGEDLRVTLAAEKSGDEEVITLEQLDRAGEYYIGSVPSALGEAKSGDKQLQVRAGDIIEVSYNDKNSAEGQMQQMLAEARVVSTASGGFTDGAFKDYVEGVYLNDDCYIRIRDLDRDEEPIRDRVKVTLYTTYRVEEELGLEGAAIRALELEETPEWEERDRLTVNLEEFAPHRGEFGGSVVVHGLEEGTEVSKNDDRLHAKEGDRIYMEYEDAVHMHGEDPRLVKIQATVVTGEQSDVKNTVSEADNPDHEARKNLIEAKLYLRLGEIFKDVGLETKARDKAENGIDRVERILNAYYDEQPLEREVVEEAFSVKWELLLVQNKLGDAIRVCGELMREFPQTTLVDKALLTIGQARMDAGENEAAVQIFQSITRLPKSEYKAQAQFLIGQIYEQQSARNKSFEARALQAYQACADTYPGSPYAGDALEKVANYYIQIKNYQKAMELFERVYMEHPDAEWLPRMLLKWGIAAYRIKDYQQAYEKFNQIVVEYPQSDEAAKAHKFMQVVQRKL
jgi:TolA-binding protein